MKRRTILNAVPLITTLLFNNLIYGACNALDTGKPVNITYEVSPNKKAFLKGEKATITYKADGKIFEGPVTIDTSTVSATKLDKKVGLSYAGIPTDAEGKDCTIEFKYTVCDFVGTLTPVDNFTGRSQAKYGLEEKVSLGYTTIPTGITATELGGLTWSKTSGVGGLVTMPSKGNATYNAKSGTGAVVLCLKSDVQTNLKKTYNRSIVAPSGTTMTRANTGVWHEKDTASAGIELIYWLTPKDVSFSNLTFAEGACPATNIQGCYSVQLPGPHGANPFGEISKGDSTKGCHVLNHDGAATIIYTLWGSGGEYTWSIPTHYITADGTHTAFGANSIQRPVISTYNGKTGYTTMNKAGNSGSAHTAEPTNKLGWK